MTKYTSELIYSRVTSLLLEKIITATELNRECKISYKSVQLMSFAADIGLNNGGVNSAFSILDKKAKIMALLVNEDQTKYLLSSSKQS